MVKTSPVSRLSKGLLAPQNYYRLKNFLFSTNSESIGFFLVRKELIVPSFDIKSELNSHELTNGVDQANRIIQNRFDLKGTGAKITLEEGKLSLVSKEEFQLHQILPILNESLTKRGLDIKSLRPQDIEITTGQAKQEIFLIEGISKEISKDIIQMVKSSKIKVQVSIQGETIRVNGKKRDDLQNVIELVKSSKIDIPLQFENFRD